MVTKHDITNLKFFLKKQNFKNDISLAPLCLLFKVREERTKQANGEIKLSW